MLIDVTVEYTDPVSPRQPERIVVTVGHPLGTEPSPLAEAIQQRESVYVESTITLPTGPLIAPGRSSFRTGV